MFHHGYHDGLEDSMWYTRGGSFALYIISCETRLCLRLSGPGRHNYTNMICAIGMATLRVTGVPTLADAHQQAVSVNDEHYNPSTPNSCVDPRVTGLPIQADTLRQAMSRTTLQLLEPHALTISKSAQLRTENLNPSTVHFIPYTHHAREGLEQLISQHNSRHEIKCIHSYPS